MLLIRQWRAEVRRKALRARYARVGIDAPIELNFCIRYALATGPHFVVSPNRLTIIR
jgi:hypothetical protein